MLTVIFVSFERKEATHRLALDAFEFNVVKLIALFAGKTISHMILIR